MGDEYFGFDIAYLWNPHTGGPTSSMVGRETPAPDSDEAANLTIEQIADQIMGEQPGTTLDRATQWGNLATMLSYLQERLFYQTTELEVEWESPAAKESFLYRVGKTLAYIQVWRDAASDNASALRDLSTEMTDAQDRMRELLVEYEAALGEQAREYLSWELEEGETVGSLTEDEIQSKVDRLADNDNVPGITELREHYDQEARQLLSDTADAYVPILNKLVYARAHMMVPLDAVLHPGAFGGPMPPLPPDGAPAPPGGFDGGASPGPAPMFGSAARLLRAPDAPMFGSAARLLRPPGATLAPGTVPSDLKPPTVPDTIGSPGAPTFAGGQGVPGPTPVAPASGLNSGPAPAFGSRGPHAFTGSQLPGTNPPGMGSGAPGGALSRSAAPPGTITPPGGGAGHGITPPPGGAAPQKPNKPNKRRGKVLDSAPPGGPGMPGLPGMGGMPGSPPPMAAGPTRRRENDQPGGPRPGVPETPDAFRTPPPATPSVLDNTKRARQRARSAAAAEAAAAEAAPSTPGATPQVLANKRLETPAGKKDRKPRTNQRRVNRRPQEQTSEFAAGVSPGTAAVFEGRLTPSHEEQVTRSADVPMALRGPTPANAAEHDRHAMPEEQADRRTRAVLPDNGAQSQPVPGAGSWDVRTPGGPVVTGTKQDDQYRAEPSPDLGAR